MQKLDCGQGLHFVFVAQAAIPRHVKLSFCSQKNVHCSVCSACL